MSNHNFKIPGWLAKILGTPMYAERVKVEWPDPPAVVANNVELPSWDDTAKAYGNEIPTADSKYASEVKAVTDRIDSSVMEDNIRAAGVVFGHIATDDTIMPFAQQVADMLQASEDEELGVSTTDSTKLPITIRIPARERLVSAINIFNCALDNNVSPQHATEAALQVFKVRYELIAAMMFFSNFGFSKIKGCNEQYEMWEAELKTQFDRREAVRDAADTEIHKYSNLLVKAINDWAVNMFDELVDSYDTRTTGPYRTAEGCLFSTELPHGPVIHKDIRESFNEFLVNLVRHYPK